MNAVSPSVLAAACLRFSAHHERRELEKEGGRVTFSQAATALADAYSETDREMFDFVMAMVDDQPELAWPVIVAAIEAAPDDTLLNALGSGLLEEFVVAHGVVQFDAIRAQAVASLPFGRALSAVWLDDEPDLARRLRPVVREPHLAAFAEYHWGGDRS